MADPVTDPTAGSGGAGDPNPPPAAPPVAPTPAIPSAPPAAAPPIDPAAAPPPDDDDKLVPRSAMLERVDRAKRSAATEAQRKHDEWLQEQFGTTDLAKIAEQRTASAKLQEEAEKRKRAEMSEVERYKTDIARTTQRCEAAEAKAEKLQRQQVIDRTRTKVQSIAAQYVDDVEYVSWKFAYYADKLPDDERKAIDEKAVGKWFAKFVKDYPKHSRTTPPVPPAKRKMTTGVAPGQGKPPPVPGAAAGKTPRPGQPNSMNKQEYSEFLKTKNISY